MYSIVLFSKHPRGLDFWRHAIEVDEQGQAQLALFGD
jgi:hypothetical protein